MDFEYVDANASWIASCTLWRFIQNVYQKGLLPELDALQGAFSHIKNYDVQTRNVLEKGPRKCPRKRPRINLGTTWELGGYNLDCNSSYNILWQFY